MENNLKPETLEIYLEEAKAGNSDLKGLYGYDHGSQCKNMSPVADPGEGPSLFWVKKEEITEGKKASRTKKSRPQKTTKRPQDHKNSFHSFHASA